MGSSYVNQSSLIDKKLRISQMESPDASPSPDCDSTNLNNKQIYSSVNLSN